MASIHSEYHRFMAHLAQREVHDDVRRFALLVLGHLQHLAEVGATRRGRSTRLVPLAIAHMAQTPLLTMEMQMAMIPVRNWGDCISSKSGHFEALCAKRRLTLVMTSPWYMVPMGQVRAAFARPWKWRCLGRSARHRLSGSIREPIATMLACVDMSLRFYLPGLKVKLFPFSQMKRNIAFVSSKTASTTSPALPRAPQVISASSSQPCSVSINSASLYVVSILARSGSDAGWPPGLSVGSASPATGEL